MRRAPLARTAPLVSRTGLRPGKPLARTGGLERTRLTSGAHRRTVRKDTGPSAKVRALVWERDGGACVACGKVIGPGEWWSMQHRLARGQGGGNEPFNLIVMCGSATSPGCHRRAEDRDREFNARGYWLNSWENPALVPVMVFSPGGSGVTAWPTQDGRWIFEAPAGASA